MPVLTPTDVADARDRVGDRVHRTPLRRSKTLSERLGTNVFVKMELFQKSGSFKPRGAFNVMLSLDDEARRAGVVGFSGGNFAQAMAYSGAALGIDTLVLMAENTPENYVSSTRGYGATVELVPDIAAAIARAEEYGRQGRTLMHPFDDPQMMAGNGAVALEIVEDVPELTHLFVSVGGGGLITGVSTAVLGARPDVKIVGVETEGADALTRSLAAGTPVTITPSSIAKTLGSPYACDAVIDLARDRLAGVEVVPDADAYRALRVIAERLKLITEPAAACTLAAADRWRDRFSPDDNVVLLLCGGNVSVADLAAWDERFG